MDDKNFNYDKHDESDSEVEHISDASEDDDDELSCELNVGNVNRKHRLRYRSVPVRKSNIGNVSQKTIFNSRTAIDRKVLATCTVPHGVVSKTSKKTVKKTVLPKKKKCNSASVANSVPSDYFLSKDGTKWQKNPLPEIKTDSENDNTFDKLNLPENVKTENPIDFFNLFFTDEVLAEIVKWTNMEALKNHSMNEEWKMTDVVELQAFFRLLIIAGHMKSCNENYRTFWHPFYGSTIFKATMGLTRFEKLLRFIRFDNKVTRSARRKTDKLCPIRDIWEKVTGNFKKYYIPSQNLTIDEQLMPCRCRCSFIQFMPKKPDKYGIKIFWICDSRTAYPLQGLVYTGKEGDKRSIDLAKTVVETLCASYYGTNRNITTDNYFTSYPLATSLLSHGLKLIGTLKKNNTRVPPEFLPNRIKKEGSTMFGFQTDVTLASHVPKVGKAVLFLSTMHHDNKVITEQVKKPISQINKHYNTTKSGVDTMDQMVHEYMTKRKTNRWPFAFFINLLDVSNIAAYTLWCKKFPLWNSKKSNKRNLLGEELVQQHITRRQETVHLPQSSREAITDYFAHVQGVKAVKRKYDYFEKATSSDSSIAAPEPKRHRCHLCPPAISKMQKQFCSSCYKNVCNSHSTSTRNCFGCRKV